MDAITNQTEAQVAADEIAALFSADSQKPAQTIEVGDTVSSAFYEFKACVVHQVSRTGRKVMVRVHGQGLLAGKMVCYWFSAEYLTIHRKWSHYARFNAKIAETAAQSA